MADLKYQPVSHDHNAFLKKARKREGFKKAYEDLEEEYTLVREMLACSLPKPASRSLQGHCVT